MAEEVKVDPKVTSATALSPEGRPMAHAEVHTHDGMKGETTTGWPAWAKPIPLGVAVTIIFLGYWAMSRDRDAELRKMNSDREIQAAADRKAMTDSAQKEREENRGLNREMITDLKESSRDIQRNHTELAERAHKAFLDQTARQWEKVAANTEATKSLAEEVKKGNDEIKKGLSEQLGQMKQLVEEVKKGKMNPHP